MKFCRYDLNYFGECVSRSVSQVLSKCRSYFLVVLKSIRVCIDKSSSEIRTRGPNKVVIITRLQYIMCIDTVKSLELKLSIPLQYDLYLDS